MKEEPERSKANKVNAKQIIELNKVTDEALAAFYKEEFGL